MARTKTIPPKLAEKCWEAAGKVTWTIEDWADYYQSLTAVFARIAARHAASKAEDMTPRLKALDELAAQAQELNMGYGPIA